MNKTLEKQAFEWLKNQQKFARGHVQRATHLGIAAQFISILQAWCLAGVASDLVFGVSLYAPLSLYIVGFILCYAAKTLCLLKKEHVGLQAAYDIKLSIFEQAQTQLVALGPKYVEQHDSAYWATAFHERLEQINDVYAKYIPQQQIIRVAMVLYILVALSMNWVIAGLFILTAPLIPVCMIIVGKRAAQANQQNFEALSQLGTQFIDRIKGLVTLKRFNQVTAHENVIAQRSLVFRQRTMAVLKLAFLSSTVLELFTVLAIALTAMYVSFSFLGYIEFGNYGVSLHYQVGLFFLLLAPEFYAPMRELGSFYHARAQGIAAVQAFQEIDEAYHALDSKHHHGHVADQHTEFSELVLNNVEIKSSTHQVLLEGISCTIKQGQKVAIVGASGAGKTTLMQTLLGEWPLSQGEMTVNHTAGNIGHLASWLGQQPFILPATIEANILFGRAALSENIATAIKLSAAEALIKQLPEGLQTVLGDQGQGVSVGQAQRIALARALLDDKKSILVLDEPTASLDLTLAKTLMETITQLDKTLILITHQLVGLEAFDQLLVIEKGKIVESGTFQTLLAQDGVFTSLYRDQQVMNA